MSKILIIDDEETLLKNFKDFLELKGYTVFACENGDAGLSVLKAEKPELLILDMHLKRGLSGVQTLRGSKMSKPDLKVIILTGFGDEYQTKSTCIAMGVNAFLSKPLSLKHLAEAIEKVMEEK